MLISEGIQYGRNKVFRCAFIQRYLRILTAKAKDLSDEWEGISGKSSISLEKLQLAAEALQSASSQPQNPAA